MHQSDVGKEGEVMLTAMDRYKLTMDELLKHPKYQTRDGYLSWVRYRRSQEHRFPPGPGSAIQRVSIAVMTEWLSANAV